MSLYKKADTAVSELAQEVLRKFDTHKPLLDVKARFDFVTARAEVDEAGMPVAPALSSGGYPALGIARIVCDRHRALGYGDAEISLDGDWWIEATDEQRAALLDHELHHVAVQTDKAGNFKFDYLGRPVLRMRKHDQQMGWFNVIAMRHGPDSLERMQAKTILDRAGQLYWPDMVKIKAERVTK